MKKKIQKRIDFREHLSGIKPLEDAPQFNSETTCPFCKKDFIVKCLSF